MINEASLADSIRRLRLGERATLAQAMTLVESRHPRHQALSTRLLDAIMPFCGNALRLGVTGTPGAGKSTFLETFGMLLIRQGLKVAIIAVDPSSPVTGGSILGDKTRMTELARSDAAFIRPVPSACHLGGASQRAQELMLLCEAAGYDVVIIETVGVGQSETEVARMVDCFISLQIAGGGDDLQGIKKGLMEMADLIVINKDDGDNHANVAIARHMYESALHIMRRKYDEWQPGSSPVARWKNTVLMRSGAQSLISKQRSLPVAVCSRYGSNNRWNGYVSKPKKRCCTTCSLMKISVAITTRHY